MVPLCFTGGTLLAQVPVPPPKVEPGLEEAVNWKWSVVAPAKPEWGLPLPEELQPKTPAAPGTNPAATPGAAEPRPTSYEVQKGDAIVKIARRFQMTPEQLKQFNELKSDRIIIGQVLRIPTAGELLAMKPPPPPPDPKAEADAAEKVKQQAEKSAETPAPPQVLTYEQMVLETVLLQVFLDREMFSPGAIDGKSGPTFEKVTQIYQQTHPDVADPAKLKAKALPR
jgi:LysM repeat protein